MARTALAVVVAALLALPVACGSVGRGLPCGVATKQPGAGLSVQLTGTPAVAGGRGEWCTVSRGVNRVVLGVLGLMAVAGRSDVRAVVDDGGSPGTLSVFGLGPGPALTGPTTVRASVLVLGPDSPAYDRTFEGALRAGGTPLEDVVYLPRSTG